MVVYRITNTVNGKVYIGKWMGKNIAHRWQRHLKSTEDGSPWHLHRAIRKYGPDVFTVTIIYRAKTADELSKMETFFIVLHQSHKPENGYNMTLGGDGIVWNEELRARMSIKRRGQGNAFFGKHHSVATKAAIGIAHIGNQHTLGRPMSTAAKEKVSECWTSKFPLKDAIRLYTEGFSIYVIASKLQVSKSVVHRRLKQASVIFRPKFVRGRIR